MIVCEPHKIFRRQQIKNEFAIEIQFFCFWLKIRDVFIIQDSGASK